MLWYMVYCKIIRVDFYETIYLKGGAVLKHIILFRDLNWIPVSPTQRQVIHHQISLNANVCFTGVKTTAN